jgi:hypothetical protein
MRFAESNRCNRGRLQNVTIVKFVNVMYVDELLYVQSRERL